MTFFIWQKFRLVLIFILMGSVVMCMGCIEDLVPHHYNLLIEGDPPVMSFYEINDHELTKLKGIKVYEINSESGVEKKMWSIFPSRNDPDGIAITSIEYGKLKEGWSEEAPAEPLTLDENHRILLQTTSGNFSVTIPRKIPNKNWGIRVRK